jgi:hypothetical protein
MPKKSKDPIAAVEKMIEKKNKKMAKFNSEYEDIQEFDEIQFNSTLRDIVESGDITGNLGRIY